MKKKRKTAFWLAILSCLLLSQVPTTILARGNPARPPSQPATSSQLYPIVQQGKWGYMDKAGKIIIQPQYEAADYFHEGLASVRQDDRVGYIDPTGKMVISLLFDDGYEFIDGVAFVRVGKRWGYIDKTGQYIWQPSK